MPPPLSLGRPLSRPPRHAVSLPPAPLQAGSRPPELAPLPAWPRLARREDIFSRLPPVITRWTSEDALPSPPSFRTQSAPAARSSSLSQCFDLPRSACAAWRDSPLRVPPLHVPYLQSPPPGLNRQATPPRAVQRLPPHQGAAKRALAESIALASCARCAGKRRPCVRSCCMPADSVVQPSKATNSYALMQIPAASCAMTGVPSASPWAGTCPRRRMMSAATPAFSAYATVWPCRTEMWPIAKGELQKSEKWLRNH